MANGEWVYKRKNKEKEQKNPYFVSTTSSSHFIESFFSKISKNDPANYNTLGDSNTLNICQEPQSLNFISLL